MIRSCSENSFIPEEIRSQGNEHTKARSKYILNIARGLFHRPHKAESEHEHGENDVEQNEQEKKLGDAPVSQKEIALNSE